jgi:hypothetical protein
MYGCLLSGRYPFQEVYTVEYLTAHSTDSLYFSPEEIGDLSQEMEFKTRAGFRGASSPVSASSLLNKFVKKAKKGQELIINLKDTPTAFIDALLSCRNVISVARKPDSLEYKFRMEGEDIGSKAFDQGFVFIGHTHPPAEYGIFTYFLPSFLDLQSSRGQRYFVLSRWGIVWYKVDETMAEVIDKQDYEDYVVSAETKRKGALTIKTELREKFGLEIVLREFVPQAGGRYAVVSEDDFLASDTRASSPVVGALVSGFTTTENLILPFDYWFDRRRMRIGIITEPRKGKLII